MPQVARRRYSDEERASAIAALAANEGNLSRTSAQIGVPVKTLENWAKGRHHPEAAEHGKQKKKDLADALESVAWKLVRAMVGKIPDASLAQVATAAGIAIDKMRLLREQPTSIGESRRDDRLEEFRRRYAEANAAGDAGADGGGEPVHPAPADGAADTLPGAGVP